LLLVNFDPADPASLNFLANVFTYMPVLALRMTPEGLVLAANPEVARATGYEVKDLIGRNFWGLLFPGKLFQQVPKFLASVKDCGSLRDRPMIMHTRERRECVVAWSRFPSVIKDGHVAEIICTGVDLTQRLIDADRPTLPEITVAPINSHAVHSADKVVEGDFVVPLAASPRAVSPKDTKAISEVQELLATVGQRGQALHATVSGFQWNIPACTTSTGTQAALRANELTMAIGHASIGEIMVKIHDVVTLCHRRKSSSA
jgi:PAS domain S-box-containing protein